MQLASRAYAINGLHRLGLTLAPAVARRVVGQLAKGGTGKVTVTFPP